MKTQLSVLFTVLIVSFLTGCATGASKTTRQLAQLDREHTVRMATLKNQAEEAKFARENGLTPPTTPPPMVRQRGPLVFSYTSPGWMNGFENWVGRNSTTFGSGYYGYPNRRIVRTYGVGAVAVVGNRGGRGGGGGLSFSYRK